MNGKGSDDDRTGRGHEGRVSVRAERLAELIEEIEDVIFVKNAEGRYEFINRAGAELLGRPIEDIIGATDSELFGHDAAHDIADIDAEILRHGETYTYERERWIGDRRRVLFTQKVPRRDADGQAYLLGVARDVTQRKAYERAALDQQRLQAVESLAGGLAHEVNNPLTYTLDNVSGLRQELPLLERALKRLRDSLHERLGDEATTAWRESGLADLDIEGLLARAVLAERGTERVRDIIRQLKLFAQPGGDSFESVTVERVLDEALELAAGELRYRTRVIKDYHDTHAIHGQPSRLRWVFLNLLFLAARRIPEGDVPNNHVTLTTDAERGRIVIELRSSAPALSAQERSTLANATEDATTASPAAISVHLAVRVVQDHEGSISVDDADGTLRARVWLPVSRRSPTRPRPRPRQKPQRRVRALVVDDEPIVATTLQRMIGRGHDVVVTFSGREAQEAIAENPEFDVVFSDLMMPQMTGMQLYGWLREEHPRLAERTVFVTGGAFTEGGREFLGDVDRPVIDKPFGPREIRRMIGEVLSEREDGS